MANQERLLPSCFLSLQKVVYGSFVFPFGKCEFWTVQKSTELIFASRKIPQDLGANGFRRMLMQYYASSKACPQKRIHVEGLRCAEWKGKLWNRLAFKWPLIEKLKCSPVIKIENSNSISRNKRAVAKITATINKPKLLVIKKIINLLGSQINRKVKDC